MTLNDTKFRASYNVLSQWDRGDYERAVEGYFKLESYVSPQMLAGREWHEKWRNYTDKTKCLPIEFGGSSMCNPETEIKLEVDLTDWLELVAVIDCKEDGVVHEYKTGISNSNSKAFKYQGGVYALACIMKDIKVNQVFIHHYNQYTKESDTSIYWITKEYLNETLNWIETLASDMFDYLKENDLFRKLKDSKISPVEIELAD